MADYDLSSYEKYLNGEPLNDELAAIRQGKVSLIEQPVEKEKAQKVSAIDEPMRELSRPERLDLRELRQSDGWPVLMRLLQKRFHVLEKAAITISQSDPLRNAQEVAERWAYLLMYKQVNFDIATMLDEELAKLRAEEQ